MVTIHQSKKYGMEYFKLILNGRVIATFLSKEYSQTKAMLYNKYLKGLQK
jgi:hypothetical protein